MSTSKNYDKMKVSELSALCKKIGTKSTGAKEDLAARLKAYDLCERLGLKAWNGANPATLTTPSVMNTANAKCGLSTMLDSWDELLQQLVKHLQANAPASSSSSSSSSSNSKSEGVGADAGIKVARRILELDETDDYLGMLNLATPQGTAPLVATSSTGTMRKNYLKLSLLIHPDKLGRVFSDATKAFQALVRALERLSSPIYAQEESSSSSRGGGRGGEKMQTISRSNEGCFRTRICCPRCRQAWSEGGLDGNPPYFYNFLMMGLKQYTCSTCLFGFGCMTAIHKCPHSGCGASFEYSPQDFHRKITCSREKCQRQFGFFLFPTSDRVLTELKQEVKQEVEAQQKAKEAKIRRAARSADRGTAAPLSKKEEIRAYMLGLSDACPLCGLELEEISEDAQREHLRECKGDKAAHAKHSSQKESMKAAADAKASKVALQESVQSEAAYQFLGAKPEQLWLMDDAALQRQAKLQDVDSSEGSSRDELIARLAMAAGSSSSGNKRALAITQDGESDGKRKGKRLTVETVPRNFASLSLPQLKSVFAAHGRVLPADITLGEVLSLIESELYDEKPKAAMALLEDGRGKKRAAAVQGNAKRRKLDEDDDEDYEDEE